MSYMASYFYCRYKMSRKNISNTRIIWRKKNKFMYLIKPFRLERINEEPEKEDMIVKRLSRENSYTCSSDDKSHIQNPKINSSKKLINRLLNHTYGLPWPSSLSFFINQKRI